MLTPGFMLGERYEIIEKIGAGGMSIVYKAKCHTLNRFVAIKVLRDEFAKDEVFVKKFKVEALSAGSLSHPNIVGIYDVGNEGDLHYIVMEYVEGTTLKEWLKEKGPFSNDKVLEYGMQIVAAIRHAHTKQIIHRDIKPQNILVDQDEVLKVTDFGIARAVDSSTIVASGNAMGSVHYFSPEQAKGKYTNETSDIYSCGIVLFELATNRVPFEADSHVSIALMHINEDLPSPRTINPEISLGLEQIILKATGKRAEERYQKAEDMLTDMKRLLADPTYTINLENEEVLDQTILLSQKDTQLLRDMPIAPQVSSESQSAPIPPQKDTDEEEISTSYKILMMAGGALATLVIMGIALVSIFFFLPSFGKTKYISVPSVIERTQEEAREILENANLKMQVTGFEASTIYEEGRILRQTPNAAETIKPGSTIEVIVATAGEVQEVVQEKVPDVTGLNASEAQRQLEIRGFLSEIIEMVYDEEVPQGKVISQEPLGNTLLNVGETVGIVVSNGSKTTMTIVPNLYNLTEAEARESLRNNMLDLGTVTEVANENIAIGHVVYQDVRANSQVEQGTLINIEISKGPQTVEEILPPEPSLPEEEPPVENVTPEEPEVAVIRQKTYVLKLPQGVEEKDDYQVLVTFETSEGILTLYESTVFKEQFPLPITISGKGSGRLITYFDGKPEYDDRIDFNEEN